jgi:transposase
MSPLRGWSLKGQRLHAKVPYGHWKTMAFLAALRCDRIDAPCVLDQPINGASFLDYVVQFLLPTLSSGDVVIMDNLASHKRPAVRQAIRSVGAKLLFRPPYSPDLNPIDPSTWLRRCLQSSNISCARQPNGLKKQLGDASEICSTASRQKNVRHILQTQAMHKSRVITL